MQRADSFEKTLMLGGIGGQEEKGTMEDEMVGWHHRHSGRGFGWTLGVGDGQGGLACCSPWGCRVGHDWATELNWTLLFPLLQQQTSRRYKLPQCTVFLLLSSQCVCNAGPWDSWVVWKCKGVNKPWDNPWPMGEGVGGQLIPLPTFEWRIQGALYRASQRMPVAWVPVSNSGENWKTHLCIGFPFLSGLLSPLPPSFSWEYPPKIVYMQPCVGLLLLGGIGAGRLEELVPEIIERRP